MDINAILWCVSAIIIGGILIIQLEKDKKNKEIFSLHEKDLLYLYKKIRLLEGDIYDLKVRINNNGN